MNEEQLRDYFAAKALQGLLAFSESDDNRGATTSGFASMTEAVKHYATLSYMYADAMMEARK